MRALHSTRTSSAAALALALFAGPALAVDGVTLIDQNRAVAGNVAPGDAAGFPVSITRAGSYRLSGNLTVPAGLNGVEIAADNVTLDLNGFSIISQGGGATAVVESGPRKFLDIGKGHLVGFASGIMALNSSHVTVQDLNSDNLSSVSIAVGGNAKLLRNSAQGLIQANCPSVIRENLTEGFITVVITSGAQCVRWNNRSLNFTGAVTQ